MKPDRVLYSRIIGLAAQGVAQQTIANEIGIERFTVQTALRVNALPARIQTAVYAGKLALSDILALDRARRTGTLTETWRRVRGGETVNIYPKIGYSKVHRAALATTNPVVRATLLWVMNKSDRLPS